MIDDKDPCRHTTPEYTAINALFYEFHSEFEAIVMDMIGGSIDKKLLDTVFSSFDELQEDYHNRLSELYGER